MKLTLLIVQILSGLGVIAAVLLHSAKGEGLGGIGGQARMFNAPKGLEEGLDRITAGFCFTFMGSAAVLALFF